jgi:hypothetical protein
MVLFGSLPFKSRVLLIQDDKTRGDFQDFQIIGKKEREREKAGKKRFNYQPNTV